MTTYKRQFSGTVVALVLVTAGCSGSVTPAGSSDPNDAPGRRDDGRDPDEPGRGDPGAPEGPGGKAGSPAAEERVPPTPRLRRLSHRQWENTVRDLLFLDQRPGLSTAFTGDAVLGRFDNAGGSLQVTEGHFADYQRAAATLAGQVVRDPERLVEIWPDDLGDARAWVESFARRAYRRPPSGQEVDELLALFEAGAQFYDSGDERTRGVRAVLETVLQSPLFLYQVETTAGEVDEPAALDDWELASRLSYAIVNSMPDAQLFAAAEAGKMAGKADVVREQARRLLSSPAGAEMRDDFHKQLWRLHTYDGIEKDPEKIPAFERGIGADMREETRRFARAISGPDGAGVRGLLTSPMSFVNRRLAPIYGIEVRGEGFEQVDLDPQRRPGVLTRSGFLASNAHRDEIDSIHRGVFVHAQVLCTELPPPVDDVPPLPEGGGLTNRERVDAHTGKGTCGQACHGAIINPAGFAFEAYDPIGKFRETDGGQPVDASGTLEIDGEEVSWTNARGFIDLVAESQAAHECMTRAWLEYLHGRKVEDEDAGLVARVGQGSRADDRSIFELLLELVTAEAFLSRI